MRVFARVILLSFALLIFPLAYLWPQSGIVSWQEGDSRALAEVMERGNFMVFRSDTVLRADSGALHKDVVFVGCNCAVDMEVEGSVVALESELGLRSRAKIGGDVLLVRSRMFQSRRSEIVGHVAATSEAEAYRTVTDHLEGGVGKRVPFRLEVRTNRMGGFALEGYDRVDGFSVSWGFKLVDPDFSRSPILEAQVLTATTHQAIGYDSRLEYPLDSRRHYLIGVSARSRTDTHDRWRLSDLDNAFTSFLFGNDYRYYYRREGYDFNFRRNLGKSSHVGLAFQNESCYSLSSLSPFTLFRENFAPNLPVANGSIHSLILRGVFDTRNDRYITLSGFWISAEGEIAGGVLGGRHSFARYDLELRRWDTFSGRHHTFIWAKLAGSDIALPFQRGYTLGNTLRAYGNFDFSGDRMLMGRVSYSVDMPNLPLVDYIFFTLCPEVIYETGIAFNKGTPGSGYDDLRSDIGYGICGRTLIGKVGMHVFRNLDGAAINPLLRITVEMSVFK